MKTVITVTEQRDGDDAEMPREVARAQIVQDDRLVSDARQRAVYRLLLQDIREQLGVVRKSKD